MSRPGGDLPHYNPHDLLAQCRWNYSRPDDRWRELAAVLFFVVGCGALWLSVSFEAAAFFGLAATYAKATIARPPR